MRHLRSIILCIAVLFQALPGAVGLHALAVANEMKAPECEMDCCAWMRQEAELRDSCMCSPTPEEPQQPTTPATLPPLAGRDIVPVVYWKSAQESAFPISAPAATPQVLCRGASETQDLATPHVRLPVLFCAILI